MLGSFWNYKDILHINVSPEFDIAHVVAIVTFKLGQSQLTWLAN